MNARKRYIPGITPDRRTRKEPDFWSKTLRWLGVTSWILMFTILAVSNKVGKSQEALGDSGVIYLGQNLAKYIFSLMVFGLVISLSGFVLIQKRNRRNTDEFTYSVLVLGLVSLCGIIYYLFIM